MTTMAFFDVSSPLLRRPSGAALALVLVAGTGLLGAGCGDDGDGDGRGSTLPGFGRWPVPRTWSSGDRFGYGVASFERTSPEDLSRQLDDRTCFLHVDFVEAIQGGTQPDIQREGPCLLTSQRGRLIGSDRVILDELPRDQLQPLCAGPVQRSTSELTGLPPFGICDPTGSLASPVQFPCDNLDGVPDYYRVESGPSDDVADVVTMLDGRVPRPVVPTIVTPDLVGNGVAVWPDGAFVVGWSGAPATAGGVELVVRRRDDTGPVLRCITDDTGQLEVPESLLGELRDQPVLVEVSRFEQVVAESEEEDEIIPVRLTYQVRESFHLNGRR